MAEQNTPKWSQLKPELESLEKSELIVLVKDLFEHSTTNRTFLAARFLSRADAQATLEKYRKQIVDQFFPKRGFGQLRLAEARKAIRAYRKASSDPIGTLDLMLSYVENGTRFTNEYGDIHEAFYNSLESVLTEAVALLKTPNAASLYFHFQPRLAALSKEARGIGWGYGDNVVDWLSELENFWMGHPEESEDE